VSKWHQIKYYLKYRLKAQSSHGAHSPFIYKLIETLIDDKNCTFAEFEQLDVVRKRLLKDTQTLTIEDLGAGSSILKSRTRKVSDIAKHSISQKRFSEFYFKLINYFNHQIVIELGTSLGLNTVYLARSGKQTKVYSIEGSKALHDYAKQIITNYPTNNVELLYGSFDREFEPLLKKLKHIDFLLVDGNHTYQATLRYFKNALPYIHENTLIVFDDIYWSEGMTKAWEEIKAHPQVSVTLDFYYCGLVFFKSGFAEPIHFSAKLN
jgi:predicted O-methyltransferase YrrM